MVGVARIELATPAMSTQCSTTELHAHVAVQLQGEGRPLTKGSRLRKRCRTVCVRYCRSHAPVRTCGRPRSLLPTLADTMVTQRGNMATITKRGNGWSVQVRRKGFSAQYRTFRLKREAEAWARMQEAGVDRQHAPADLRALRRMTLGDVLRRYLIEVTPRKRSADSERLRLGKVLRAPLCDLALADLTAGPLAAYRDERLRSVRPGTVRRELSLIRHALEIARCEWDVALPDNPLGRVSLPSLRNARTRRLNPGEIERLREALGRARNPLPLAIVTFAIDTGLRRGEILQLRWCHVNIANRTAHIPQTKTGHPRTIPLTDGALAVLSALTCGGEDRVFPMSPVALRLAWDRACIRAGLQDLRFHDMRHEALSRFAELGLTVPELAVISGHRDPRMLFRYTHLRPHDLAAKLAGRCWTDQSARGATSAT